MEDRPDSRNLSRTISTSAVQVVHQHTGRGPTQAKTTINGDTVMILLADTLTKGERTLVDHGHGNEVIKLRHDFQMIMRKDLVALVESELGRKVVAFMSQNHIDPDLAVEVFVLEPAKAKN